MPLWGAHRQLFQRFAALFNIGRYVWFLCLCVFLTCPYRVLKGGSPTFFGLQWTYSLHKPLQLLASGFFHQVQKHAPVVETALTQNSWKHFKHSNFHFIQMLSILLNLSMCNCICVLL